MKQKNTKKGKKFWDSEYSGRKKDQNINISDKPSGDLVKFMRWLRKNKNNITELNNSSKVYEIGCGNGRNLIYLSNDFGLKGEGFDISEEAIKKAKEKSGKLTIKYAIKELTTVLNKNDNSVDIVLDLMVSHFLKPKERDELHKEFFRILKPGGWFLYKTFLLDGDVNAKNMIKKYGDSETNSYIHPNSRLYEHVSTVEEIKKELQKAGFKIHKILKSHNPKKRRNVVFYVEKY